MKNSRRDFIKKTSMTSIGAYFGNLSVPAKNYRKILGANDRVRVGVVGYSDRFKDAHLPSFLQLYKELNFDIISATKSDGEEIHSMSRYTTWTSLSCWSRRFTITLVFPNLRGPRSRMLLFSSLAQIFLTSSFWL